MAYPGPVCDMRCCRVRECVNKAFHAAGLVCVCACICLYVYVCVCLCIVLSARLTMSKAVGKGVAKAGLEDWAALMAGKKISRIRQACEHMSTSRHTRSQASCRGTCLAINPSANHHTGTIGHGTQSTINIHVPATKESPQIIFQNPYIIDSETSVYVYELYV